MHRCLVVTAWALVASAASAQDSTFLLSTGDPGYRVPGFLGNGRLSLVMTPTGLAAAASYLAGVYEHAPHDIPRIAAVPAWNAILLSDRRDTLGATSRPAGLRAYRQTLNMYDGSTRTTYDWVHAGRAIAVRVDAFISRADPNLGAIRLEIVPRRAGRLTVSFPLQERSPPSRLALAEIETFQPGWTNDTVWYPGHMTVLQRDAAVDSLGGVLHIVSRAVGASVPVAQAASIAWTGLPRTAEGSARTVAGGASIDVSFDAAAGRRYTFYKYVAVVPSFDAAHPLPRALALATSARVHGWDALAAASARAWHDRWSTDIVLDGDAELQRLVRAMLYSLLASADSGTALGIPPMGLSSGGYYGHIFWDSDSWMFPALVLTHPDIARSLVRFRYQALDAARRNARSNGFLGAQYPWESDELGEETTPRFAAQNASSEVHVTGDVALAQWQYFLASGDTAWLANEGEPVIRNTADFWVSRASYDSARGRADIRSVVSVDEGLVGISNDACTNAVARRTLEIAVATARLLRRTPDPRWERVAAALVIPMDTVGAYHRTYEGAPDSTLGSVVPLLSFPLQIPMAERVKRTNLEHAARRLAFEGGGAMMTTSLYPVVAAELGDSVLFESLLPESYQGHVRRPFYALAETSRNDAVNFLTGAGAFLQQVIFGYTGLRLGDRGLERSFAPMLPQRIRRLTLRNIQARGHHYDIMVEARTLVMEERR